MRGLASGVIMMNVSAPEIAKSSDSAFGAGKPQQDGKLSRPHPWDQIFKKTCGAALGVLMRIFLGAEFREGLETNSSAFVPERVPWEVDFALGGCHRIPETTRTMWAEFRGGFKTKPSESAPGKVTQAPFQIHQIDSPSSMSLRSSSPRRVVPWAMQPSMRQQPIVPMEPEQRIG